MTTEPVLLEVGNALAGLHWRGLGVALLSRLRSDSGIEVLPLSPQLFSRALELYAARPDKEWGLTDCVSFVVMRDRGIQEALSADQHFVQAGFRALLPDSARSVAPGPGSRRPAFSLGGGGGLSARPWLRQ